MATCATSCLKLLLTVFNFIFLITGAVIFGLGIWYMVDLHNYIGLGSDHDKAAAAVLLTTGSLIMVFTIAACCCTLRARYAPPLYMYAFFLCVVFLAELACGISLFVFKSDLGDAFSSTLNNTIQEKWQDKQKDINNLQKELKCCGSYNYTDWFTVEVDPHNPNTVPQSCCRESGCHRTNLPDTPGNATDGIYTKGCATDIVDKLNSNIGEIGGAAIGFSFLQLIGAILACCLGRSIKNDNYDQFA